ncbi:carboxymuconolactone decarboxylase family protein [Haloplanus litoreus]
MRLKVADIHQCGYCATVRTLDVREAVAAKEEFVFGEVDPDGLTRREYLAVSLAEGIGRDAHGITDERFVALREEFTEQAVVELLLCAALEVGRDRFCTALRLQPTDDQYPDEVSYPLTDPPRTSETGVDDSDRSTPPVRRRPAPRRRRRASRPRARPECA